MQAAGGGLLQEVGAQIPHPPPTTLADSLLSHQTLNYMFSFISERRVHFSNPSPSRCPHPFTAHQGDGAGDSCQAASTGAPGGSGCGPQAAQGCGDAG